jgi:hypothetical protein
MNARRRLPEDRATARAKFVLGLGGFAKEVAHFGDQDLKILKHQALRFGFWIETKQVCPHQLDLKTNAL